MPSSTAGSNSMPSLPSCSPGRTCSTSLSPAALHRRRCAMWPTRSATSAWRSTPSRAASRPCPASSSESGVMTILCRFACLLFLSAAAWAADGDVLGNIPAEIRAEAQILRAERDGYWEKVLIVSFPEARRTLSTSDGLLDARAALNHAGHPQLWYKLGTEFMGRDGRGGKAYAEHVHANTAKLLQLDK